MSLGKIWGKFFVDRRTGLACGRRMRGCNRIYFSIIWDIRFTQELFSASTLLIALALAAPRCFGVYFLGFCRRYAMPAILIYIEHSISALTNQTSQ